MGLFFIKLWFYLVITFRLYFGYQIRPHMTVSLVKFGSTFVIPRRGIGKGGKN